MVNIRIAAALTAAAISFQAFADSVLEPDNPDAVKYLSENAPSGFTNNGVPNFVVTGIPGKFYFGFGGQIKATVGFDTGHPIATADEFTTSAIPMGNQNGNGADFHISARQTSFYVNAVALPESNNRIGAFVSFNLVNPNYVPSLVYAYLRWRGLQAGYDYNLFSDPSSNPPGIDYEGANAILATGAASLRWTRKFGKGARWSAAVALEMPQTSFTNAMTGGITYAQGVSQRLPDIPVALQYSWTTGSHVRIAAIMRNLYSRQTATGKNVDRVGWGLHLSAAGAILPSLTGYAAGWFGRGIASYCQDLSGMGLDLVPTADGKSLTTPGVWGAYAGLDYFFCPKWDLAVTYSQVRAYADRYEGGAVAWGDQYRYAQYVSGTLTYTFNNLFSTACEYIWGRRVNNSGEKAADTRLQAAFTFCF